MIRYSATVSQFGGNSEYTDGKAGRARRDLNEVENEGQKRKRLTAGEACCIVSVHVLSL